jgi:glycosidase
VQYAENPPKKYQDIYPLDFECADRRSLWEELRRIVFFWIGHGVRIFRVDNPHTKPFAFWEWLIREVQAAHPDVLFLAEAFTRPKVMRYLAKLGFSQSYTHFTWRNTKTELTEYLTELTCRTCCSMRPNPPTPESSTGISRSVVGRNFRSGSSWPPRWARRTASTARPSSCARRRRYPGRRNIGTGRNTRSDTGISNEPTVYGPSSPA